MGLRGLTIVAGGQTGVDRAALDAALAAGAACGGWCPAGRLAEDGRIPAHYPLRELPGSGYVERTARNVRDSDATALCFDARPLGGTAWTLRCCLSLGRPFLLLDARATTPQAAAAALRRFVAAHRVRRLNVAGPRASEAPGLYAFVRETLNRLLAGQAADGGR